MATKKDFPSELITPVANVQSSLNNLNKILEVSQKIPSKELAEEKKLNSIEKAKLDCISAFALNTLVWTWVRTIGENPKEAGVKFELDRAKAAMIRLKQIQDKAKRNPVDSQAAKRLVKGSLWTPKDKAEKRSTSNNDSTTSTNTNQNSKYSKKTKY